MTGLWPDCGVPVAARNAQTVAALSALTAGNHIRTAYAMPTPILGKLSVNWGQVGPFTGYAMRLAPQSPVARTLMGLYWDRQAWRRLSWVPRAYSAIKTASMFGDRHIIAERATAAESGYTSPDDHEVLQYENSGFPHLNFG
jgi:hypothetical protein